ncbi:MAG TPA: hypothetical protein VES89_13855 [Candidatus Competibacteraceae bacterium]|nr:hypothetical protein [Candidatus Competibacteraceae bacterium]
MKEGSNENLLDTWTETQKYLHQNFFKILPRLPLPTGLEGWQDAYLQQLAGWETLVKQALQTETTWVEQWAGKAASGPPGTMDLVSTWGRQMEGLLRQWLSIQAQLWDEFFEVLRHGGIALAPTSFDSDTETAPAKAAPAHTAAKRVSSTVISAVSQAATETAIPSKAPVTEPDDLTLISGIGITTAQKLQAAGIFSYRQLATLGGEEIERLEATIKRPGRIHRDQWIEQARELHLQKYQEKL